LLGGCGDPTGAEVFDLNSTTFIALPPLNVPRVGNTQCIPLKGGGVPVGQYVVVCGGEEEPQSLRVEGFNVHRPLDGFTLLPPAMPIGSDMLLSHALSGADDDGTFTLILTHWDTSGIWTFDWGSAPDGSMSTLTMVTDPSRQPVAANRWGGMAWPITAGMGVKAIVCGWRMGSPGSVFLEEILDDGTVIMGSQSAYHSSGTSPRPVSGDRDQMRVVQFGHTIHLLGSRTYTNPMRDRDIVTYRSDESVQADRLRVYEEWIPLSIDGISVPPLYDAGVAKLGEHRALLVVVVPSSTTATTPKRMIGLLFDSRELLHEPHHGFSWVPETVSYPTPSTSIQWIVGEAYAPPHGNGITAVTTNKILIPSLEASLLYIE
jgi:hypothetical protein